MRQSSVISTVVRFEARAHTADRKSEYMTALKLATDDKIAIKRRHCS